MYKMRTLQGCVSRWTPAMKKFSRSVFFLTNATASSCCPVDPQLICKKLIILLVQCLVFCNQWEFILVFNECAKCQAWCRCVFYECCRIDNGSKILNFCFAFSPFQAIQESFVESRKGGRSAGEKLEPEDLNLMLTVMRWDRAETICAVCESKHTALNTY